jgi:hypothetical protein
LCNGIHDDHRLPRLALPQRHQHGLQHQLPILATTHRPANDDQYVSELQGEYPEYFVFEKPPGVVVGGNYFICAQQDGRYVLLYLDPELSP